MAKKTVKIWMCQDADDKTQSGFAKSKRAAEFYVANNRGYTNTRDCRRDEWMKQAIQIEVHPIAAAVLLGICGE